MQTTPAILPESFHPANPQDVGAARSPGHSIRDRSAKQLTFGPSEAVKSKPTIARLRDAMDAFNIRGTCRLVAYELLTYWQPGGDVFPSVQTIADGLGLTPRVVQRHLARLERKGLWVRIARVNSTNLYELKLPGRVTVATGGGERSVTPGVNVASPISNQREVTSTANTAAAVVLPAAVSPFKDSQQQQQIKSEQRIEGLIGACAARARKLKRPIDEPLERHRLADGEIDVDDLQRLADELQHEIDGRQYRWATMNEACPAPDSIWALSVLRSDGVFVGHVATSTIKRCLVCATKGKGESNEHTHPARP